MKDKILSYPYTMITLDKLMSMAGRMDYPEFAHLINRLIEEELLDPVKASGKNGRRPPLPNKFRIIKPKKDYTKALEEIKLLHPSFNHSKYARQPDMYIKHKQEIDALSKFLWEHEDLLQSPMSINERSFQIWGLEKLLKEKSVIKTIFQFNDWDLSLLNYYETPEPFFEYNFSAAEEMNILIIENKDTWFTIRKIMREDGLNRLFRDYHVLLYGEGKKIISRDNRLEEYDKLQQGSFQSAARKSGDTRNDSGFRTPDDKNCACLTQEESHSRHGQTAPGKNNYYYFGDLDYEGIEIFQTLKAENPGLNIFLCTELYSWMLRESKKYRLPKTKEGQRRRSIDIDLFLQHFPAAEQAQIKGILGQGTYIPQEILNYPLLRSKMMEGLTKE